MGRAKASSFERQGALPLVLKIGGGEKNRRGKTMPRAEEKGRVSAGSQRRGE
ncbi:hypothetical protein HMPREF9004_1645 [Schaalia cardiffensis F0333]|uniref:Uncharacterized protein n=1 Tax=Schaalia cardiffensis F0333 TaxID=888050 RepID=N6W5I1_9ACTO|nr:hypothetical protein HMPREF9004_1645 [Schaalia cardiffensis F0333]